MSNELTTISAPAAQTVVSTEQRALRMFPTMAKPAAAAHANPLVQTAAAELADYKDTLARLAPEHITMAQQTFQRFGNAKVKQVVLERGWGSEPQTIGFVAQLGYHIEKLETEIAQLRARK